MSADGEEILKYETSVVYYEMSVVNYEMSL